MQCLLTRQRNDQYLFPIGQIFLPIEFSLTHFLLESLPKTLTAVFISFYLL